MVLPLMHTFSGPFITCVAYLCLTADWPLQKSHPMTEFKERKITSDNKICQKEKATQLHLLMMQTSSL